MLLLNAFNFDVSFRGNVGAILYGCPRGSKSFCLESLLLLPDGYSDTLIMTETLDEIMADKLVSLVNCHLGFALAQATGCWDQNRMD